jgi:PAS domain S-box-containing protein
MTLREETDTANNHFSLFEGDGEMASLMRVYNWEAHPLGSPEAWPESLKTTIRLILHSEFPMFIWWSKDLYMFHNDAYLPALGEKHPRALGASAKEMWVEIWEQIGSVVEGVLEQGKPFYARELRLFLERKGFSEETFWTFSYSPAPGDGGEIGGLFCACTEVTNAVLGQRRLRIIKDIADATAQLQTVEEAGSLTAKVLSENTDDIPFSLIYLLNGEGTQVRLLGQSGKLPEEWATREVELRQENMDNWCMAAVWRSKKMKTIDLPVSNEQLWGEDNEGAFVKKAVVLPLLKPGEDQLIGFFVSAVSPKLEYDADYQNFHGLLAGKIATSLASIQSREEVVRQQEELVGLFEQAPVAIAIMREEKLVVELANPPMCELWGRSHREVINKPVFDALPEARGQGLEELLQDVLTTGAAHSFSEFPLVLNRNGKDETVYVNFTYYPFRNTKGVIKGVTAIAVEVTEQVMARNEIEAKNKELLAINADLDTFVYSASHDLKGPILNVEGLMKVLLPKLPAESVQLPEVEQVLNMIFSSIERLKATIADLSEVSRVQKEADEDIRIVDISELVSDVMSDMALEIKETGSDIKVELNSCHLRFSPKNLRSVVYNLLSNAIKYRSPNRQPLIFINCEDKGDELLLSVSDNGLGINLKYKSKIFSMFKRLHSHVEGTGVGLYIVKRIVENAGGRIEVESELGEGSSFRVYFKKE